MPIYHVKKIDREVKWWVVATSNLPDCFLTARRGTTSIIPLHCTWGVVFLFEKCSLGNKTTKHDFEPYIRIQPSQPMQPFMIELRVTQGVTSNSNKKPFWSNTYVSIRNMTNKFHNAINILSCLRLCRNSLILSPKRKGKRWLINISDKP